MEHDLVTITGTTDEGNRHDMTDEGKGQGVRAWMRALTAWNEDGGKVAWTRRPGACNTGSSVVAQTRGKVVWNEDGSVVARTRGKAAWNKDSGVVAQVWRATGKMHGCGDPMQPFNYMKLISYN